MIYAYIYELQNNDSIGILIYIYIYIHRSHDSQSWSWSNVRDVPQRGFSRCKASSMIIRIIRARRVQGIYISHYLSGYFNRIVPRGCWIRINVSFIRCQGVSMLSKITILSTLIDSMEEETHLQIYICMHHLDLIYLYVL